MTVAKYVAPNYTDVAQTAAIYKGYIDGGMSVLHAVAGDFAPHAQDTPNMTIACDAGKIIKGDGTLTEQAAQNTGTITAPVTNPRIDRVVIDASTGAVSVITGAEAASPTAPSITAGKLPVAQIALTTSTTAITNSIITDERTAYKYQNIVTLDLFRRNESTATTTGATVTAVATSVASISLGTVNSGDRVNVSGWFQGTKGATAGITRAQFVTSGTATVSLAGGAYANQYTAISTEVGFSISAWILVTGSGTLTVDLKGISAGSDLTVPNTQGSLYGIVLRAD